MAELVLPKSSRRAQSFYGPILLLLIPTCCVCMFQEQQESQLDLQSAVLVNQMALVQQTEAVKKLLNLSKTDQCSSCFGEGAIRAIEAMVGLREYMTSFLQTPNYTKRGKGCPHPFTEVVEECFYAHGKKLTWLQAKHVCQGMGGELAQPKHLYALQAHLADNFGPSYFWVGGTDLDHEGNWTWLSGRMIDPADWLFSRPDNLAGDEHCLEIVMSDYPKVFNDETCSVTQKFICQYWQ